MPCSDKREIKNEIRGDFAAVDVREELCYHSLPKKQLEEGEMRRKAPVRHSNGLGYLLWRKAAGKGADGI